MIKVKLPTILTLLCLAAAAPAAPQSYGDDVVATVIAPWFPTIDVSNGSWTTAATGVISRGLAIASNNRDYVVTPRNGQGIVQIDRTTSAARTIYGGTEYFWAITATGDGNFAAVTLNGLYAVRGDGSGAASLRSGLPFRNLRCICQDLRTGGYVVGDPTDQALHFVTRGGQITATVGGASGLYVVQDHRNGACYTTNGGLRTLFAVSPTGAVRTLNAAFPVPVNAVALDRGGSKGLLVTGDNPVMRVDAGTGAIVTMHRTVSGTKTAFCFDRSRNLVAPAIGPKRHRIQIDLPSAPGKPYLLAASAGGFTPGLSIAGRYVPIVADTVFLLSVQGLLAPYLRNNAGTLDGQGAATATLDLSTLGGLSGARLWLVCVTLDANAPSGLGVITKPIVIVLT